MNYTTSLFWPQNYTDNKHAKLANFVIEAGDQLSTFLKPSRNFENEKMGKSRSDSGIFLQKLRGMCNAKPSGGGARGRTKKKKYKKNECPMKSIGTRRKMYANALSADWTQRTSSTTTHTWTILAKLTFFALLVGVVCLWFSSLECIFLLLFAVLYVNFMHTRYCILMLNYSN